MKKQKLTVVVLLIIGAVAGLYIGSSPSFRADILGAFDQIRNTSPYSVDNVQMERNYLGGDDYETIVRGQIYKEKEDIDKPYVIVHVDFLDDKKKDIDSRSITLDSSDLALGEKRSFEVKTSVSGVVSYSYYLE